VPPQHLPRFCDCRVADPPQHLTRLRACLVFFITTEYMHDKKMMLSYVRHGSAIVFRTGASEPHRVTDRPPQTRHSIQYIPQNKEDKTQIDMRNGEDRGSSEHVPSLHLPRRCDSRVADPPQRLPRLRDCRVSSQLSESVIVKLMLSYVRHGSARVSRTGASEPHRGTDGQPQTRHSIRYIPHICITVNISDIGCNEPWRLPRLCDCRVSFQSVKQIR
jgi:hypothetical protein